MASSPHKAVALLIKQTLEAERETRCSERHANGGLREKAVSPHHLYFRNGLRSAFNGIRTLFNHRGIDIFFDLPSYLV